MLKISKSFFPLLLLLVIGLQATPLKPEGIDLQAHPPRIIRTCCMFGSRVGVVLVPFLKLSAITSPEKMGAHLYLGGARENNGVVYTRKGGFIDMGHLRDQADWTAYLFSLLSEEQKNGFLDRDLGYEGGEKRLMVTIPAGIPGEELLRLSGRIAYDLSVWHEIATWYGVSSVPLVSEQYSSFSPEDLYSNLLGVFLGIEAVKSELPYNEAMTLLLGNKLKELEAVDSEEETAVAMEAVRDIWWTRTRRYPSSKVVMLRHTSPYDPVCPFLVPSAEATPLVYEPVCLPSVISLECATDSLYEFTIKLNHKFPLRELFPERGERFITHRDFDTLVQDIRRKYETGFLIPNKIRNAGIDTIPSPEKQGRMKSRKHKRQKYGS